MKSREEIISLIAEIKGELRDIEILSESIKALKTKIEKGIGEEEYLVESAALKLQNFYTACERIFEKIAGEINGGVPTTPDWHHRLLKVMTLDIPEIRPPVITPNLEKRLLEYLKFRHIVRSIYGFELEVERLRPLMDDVPKVSLQLKEEVEKFFDFLKTIKEICNAPSQI